MNSPLYEAVHVAMHHVVRAADAHAQGDVETMDSSLAVAAGLISRAVKAEVQRAREVDREAMHEAPTRKMPPDLCVCGNGEAEGDRGAVLRCPVHGPGVT